jgi:hypothetical protein
MSKNHHTAYYFETFPDNIIIIVCTMIYHSLNEYASGVRKVIKFEGSDIDGK